MKITNFYPEKINNSNELLSFDNCLIEYFEDIEFAMFGTIEIINDVDSIISILIATDENGRNITLNADIKKEIEAVIENEFIKTL